MPMGWSWIGTNEDGIVESQSMPLTIRSVVKEEHRGRVLGGVL